MNINNRLLHGPCGDPRIKIRPQSNKDWDERRSVIEQLYKDYGLHKVMELMSEQNFVATEKQYKRKIKLWKIGKNTKREEYHYMQIIQAIRLLQGKRTQFILRGRLVPPTKIVQFVKRDRRALKKQDLLCSHFVSTPPDISYATPTESMASPGRNGQDNPEPTAAYMKSAERGGTPEDFEVQLVLPPQKSTREDQSRNDSKAGTQEIMNEIPGLKSKSPSTEQVKMAADLAFVMTDSARAFELYHKLYTSMDLSSTAPNYKEILVTALIRSVRNIESARKAKNILLEHFAEGFPHLLPWLLDIWLDFVMDNLDCHRLKSIKEDIVCAGRDLVQLSYRGSSFDAVMYQALHFGNHMHTNNLPSLTISVPGKNDSTKSFFPLCSVSDRVYCVRTCVNWCMKQLGSQGWGYPSDPLPTLPAGTMLKEETLFNVFYCLWNLWQRSGLDQMSGMSWAQQAEEQLNISATELLLIVSDMIIDDTETECIGNDIFKRGCMSRAKYLSSFDDIRLHLILVDKLVDGRLYRGINRTWHTLPQFTSDGVYQNRKPLFDYVRGHAGKVLGVSFESTFSLSYIDHHIEDCLVPNPASVPGDVKLKRYYLPNLEHPCIEAAAGVDPNCYSNDMGLASSQDRQPEHLANPQALVRAWDDVTLKSSLGSSSMSLKEGKRLRDIFKRRQ